MPSQRQYDRMAIAPERAAEAPPRFQRQMLGLSGRSWLLIGAMIVAVVELALAVSKTSFYARIGWKNLHAPKQLVRDADVDPFAYYDPTLPMVAAGRAIPRNATYTIVVGRERDRDGAGARDRRLPALARATPLHDRHPQGAVGAHLLEVVRVPGRSVHDRDRSRPGSECREAGRSEEVTRLDLGPLALDLMYLAVGYALLYATGIVRLRRGDVRFVGLAFLAGWALMGSVLSLLLMAGIGLYVATVPVAAVVVAAACVGVARWRPNRVPPGVAHGWSAPGAIVAGLAGAVIVVAGAAAVLTAVGSQWNPEFDLLSTWLPRAQIVYYLHQLNPSQWSSFIDPWYPPLVPVMFGATWQYAGGFHPSVLPIQQVVLGLVVRARRARAARPLRARGGSRSRRSRSCW